MIDPTDASIVATGELDELIRGTSGQIVYSLEEHDLGFLFPRIWSLHLRDP